MPNDKIRVEIGKRHLEEERIEHETASSSPADDKDGWPGTKEERAEFDARAELEAWELAQNVLTPWTETSKPIGSPELTRMMEKAPSEVKDTVERAREPNCNCFPKGDTGALSRVPVLF